MNNLNVLVTGGAGFIGSNLVKLLLKKKCNVTIIDNLSTGYIENIQNLDITFHKGDILDSDLINSIGNDIDIVFHLAASVGRQKSIDNPQQDSNINLLGTLNILESMVKNKIPKIIYSSSAAIFGELATDSIDENHPINPDSPYGVSKLAAEKMILAYSEIYNITGICLRYFNIYGVNQRYDQYGNVIPKFAKRIFDLDPITIYGDGEQTRDFVNVKDVAMVNYLSAITNLKTNVYNIGSGTSITINKLAELMTEYSKINVPITYENSKKGDVKHCKANTTKLATQLGFTTTIDLEIGLKEYINWFKEQSIKR